MDTGQILAGHNENNTHPPASTIKTLLAQWSSTRCRWTRRSWPLTPIPMSSATAPASRRAGPTPRASFSTRLLLVSGNDAANTLARMLGGYDAAVAKMNAKAALLGAHGHQRRRPVGLDGPGRRRGPLRTTSPSSSAPRWPTRCSPQITAQPSRDVPRRKTGDKVLVNQDEMMHRYPGMLGGKTGFTDSPARRSSGPPTATAAAWWSR